MPAITLEQLLRHHGLRECSECRSWYGRSSAARFFHARRCSPSEAV